MLLGLEELDCSGFGKRDQGTEELFIIIKYLGCDRIGVAYRQDPDHGRAGILQYS